LTEICPADTETEGQEECERLFARLTERH